jgi:hypothetical protein
VWWQELIKDLIGGSLVVLHLYEEMLILDLKDERNGLHWRHKRLREGRLVSRPESWLVFIA